MIGQTLTLLVLWTAKTGDFVRCWRLDPLSRDKSREENPSAGQKKMENERKSKKNFQQKKERKNDLLD